MNSSSELPQSVWTLQRRRRWRQVLRRHQQDGPNAPLAPAMYAQSLTLRELLATLRPTVLALNEPICALDLEGCIQFVNQDFARALGRPEADLIGADITDLIRCVSDHTSDHTPHRASDHTDGLLHSAPQNATLGATFAPPHLRSALALSIPLELGECAWRQPDGSARWWRCSLRPLIHEGQALGAMLIAPGATPEEPTPAEGDARPEGQVVASAVAQVERRLRVLEAVGDIALARLPLEDLLQALLDAMRREMQLENVAIFLMNEAGDALVAHTASGAGAEIADQVRLPVGQGAIGEVMRNRRPIHIPCVDSVASRSELFTPQLRAAMSLGSLILTPLVVEQRAIGALYLGASDPEYFAQEDVRLVELVGERAALAIERARASDEASRAHERLRFLSDASVALAATLDYRDITHRLAAILTPALADASAVYLVEDDGLLRKAAERAPSPDAGPPDPLNDALRGLIERQTGAIEVSRDTTCAIARSVHTLAPVFERQPLVAAMDAQGAEARALCVAAPLVVRQHALGALYLARRSGKDFAADDLALIQGLAERAAIAIDNARLYIETQQALASGSATATQLDTIFNATDVGIFVTDAEGTILRINPYGAQMLGMQPLSVQASPFVHAHDSAPPLFELRTQDGEAIPREHEPIHLARTLGRPVEQRLVIHRRDTGKDIEALARCTPWRDAHGQIAGSIAVVTDITTISRLERQKDEFLGLASHELKTPLTSLKILAQLLRKKLEASGDSRELAQAKRMQVSIIRMERLIADLLDVSLIQEGKLALNQELTDLSEIGAEAVSEQETLTQRVIRFTTASDAPAPIYADRERIYQSMTNLLSNALKYSHSTEVVDVRVYATSSECIVSVRDRGPGVPEEAQDHIFERFYRVPGMQVQSGSGVGLGLGLHISKEIIMRHGGRIWVESKLGHGSVFSFALPRADAAPQAVAPA